MENTVTISLEKYERMVRRIEELESEVENKTIEVPPKWWEITTLIVVGAVMILFIIYR